MAFAPPLAFDYLARAHTGGRLGHAYLLAGTLQPAADLAAQLAALVVGASSNTILSNPDIHLVEPESKSRRITVEQIRDLESALRLRASTAAAGGRKVGIIREADRLNAQSSNAFLKTLEEPPAGSLLLLVTAQPESLMETILSRCIKVTLQTDAETVYTPEESALHDLLGRFAQSPGDSGVSTAYRLLRDFTGLLASVRSGLQADAEAALEREEKHYAQTTDGSWLAEREGYYKSLTESRYVAGRARLVEALARWWGDALRRAMTDGNSAKVADVLRRLAAVEELRENLDRNIQEALALEVAFLQIFGS